jgi:hypothetical protein
LAPNELQLVIFTIRDCDGTEINSSSRWTICDPSGIKRQKVRYPW